MESPISMQEVLRHFVKKRVEKYTRAGLAKKLGMSTTGLDYWTAGQRRVKDKKTGKDRIQPNFISFEHVEQIAQACGQTLTYVMEEIAVITATMEAERKAAKRQTSAETTGRPLDDDR